MQPCEAKESNGTKIFLTGWFRITLAGFAGFVVSGFAFLGSNVIANDNKYMDKISINSTNISRLDVQFSYIKEDLNEIKELLKRRVP